MYLLIEYLLLLYILELVTPVLENPYITTLLTSITLIISYPIV